MDTIIHDEMPKKNPLSTQINLKSSPAITLYPLLMMKSGSRT